MSSARCGRPFEVVSAVLPVRSTIACTCLRKFDMLSNSITSTASSNRVAGLGMQRVPVAIPMLLGKKLQRLAVGYGVARRGQRLTQGLGLCLEIIQGWGWYRHFKPLSHSCAEFKLVLALPTNRRTGVS
jgi:hypothetical protein